MAGAVAGRGVAVDGGRAEHVVAFDCFRPEDRFHRDQGPHGDHLAVFVAHIELADIVGAAAPVRLGLDIDPVDPAELIEIVHVVGADIGVQHGEDVVDADTFDLGTLAIDIDEDLRRVRPEGAEHARQLRPRVGRDDQAAQNGGERLWRPAFGILKNELKAPRAAEPRDRRRNEGKDDRARDGGELWRDVPHDGAQMEFRRGALAPGFQNGDDKCAVGYHGALQQAVAAHRDNIRYAGVLRQDMFDLGENGGGARQRCAVW